MLYRYRHSIDTFRIFSDIQNAPFLAEDSEWLKDIISFFKQLHLLIVWLDYEYSCVFFCCCY